MVAVGAMARATSGFRLVSVMDAVPTAVEDAMPVAREASSASLRRNEPELSEVLQVEPLPAVNVPPSTDWFDPEQPSQVPDPLTSEQLIPAAVRQRVEAHIRRVQECYRRAEGSKKEGKDAAKNETNARRARACRPRTPRRRSRRACGPSA